MSRWKHEESIRNKLEKYRPEVDKNALWESVRHEVPQRKRRPVLIWLLLGGSVGLGLLLGKSDLLTSRLAEEHPEVAATNLPSEAFMDSGVAATSVGSETDDIKVAEVNKTEVGSELEKSDRAMAAPLVTASNVTRGENRNTQSHSPQQVFKSGTEQRGDTQYSSSADVIKPNIESAEGDNFDVAIAQASYPAERVPGVAIDLLHFSESQDQTTLAMPSAIHRKRNARIGLLLTGGSGIASARYSNVSGLESFDAVSNSIQQLPAIFAGLNLVLPVGQKWRISPGVTYTRNASRMTLQTESRQRIMQNGVQTIIIDENGDVQNVMGTIGATEVTRTQGTYYTLIHSLDMNVQVGYRVWSDSRLRVFAQGGAFVHVVLGSEGTMSDGSGTLTRWPDEAEVPYRAGTLGWQAGLSLEYQVASNLAFVFNPLFEQRMLRYDDNKIAFEQGITTIGCRLGALIQL